LQGRPSGGFFVFGLRLNPALTRRNLGGSMAKLLYAFWKTKNTCLFWLTLSDQILWAAREIADFILTFQYLVMISAQFSGFRESVSHQVFVSGS
jgi:hypothetical protein